MLDAAARFHTYSLGNQLLIALQAARLGISPTRVAGFGTWKALGRSVVKGSTGLAVLAPCHLHAQGRRHLVPDQCRLRRTPGRTDRRDGGAAVWRGRRPAGLGAGAARVPGRPRLRRLPDRGRPAARRPAGAADR
ncbi:ArdC family protein [Blastococcus sp. TML/C7B]|uniref:ArdC family protein n=1 Tax=unclassified Blastococcus TaxID=2619396 RepID=UPI0035C926B1